MPEFVGNKSGDSLDEIVDLDCHTVNSIIIQTLSKKRKNMQLEDLKVVFKVAELRSITAAATNLDMGKATASAALKRVEIALGVELFIHTTRQLRLGVLARWNIIQNQDER